ncbi:hypothetical protein SNE40_018638 [Patella caerulea]|uniref:BTB domain-containing protein n=1 Tax=Patella caerulea TaxID=87958 RepID=A0AAN8J719_PATCE
MPIKLDCECGPKCRSHQHALYINSAIIKGGIKEFKAYSSLCANATNVNDKFGRNVLHMAASCGRIDIIEYLLEEKHYNLKAKDYESGWTALHRSLFYGQIAAARLLIQYKHDLRGRDHEGLTPLDIVMKDRPDYISFSPREPNEVYTWGDNSNYNLGHSSAEDKRMIPERVGMFKRVSGYVIQVVMCKFHTVFLTQIGQVYSCGHGHGGRLGHGDQQTSVVPRLVDALKRETCVQVAAARDHTLFFMEKGTVYGCGSNESHQLALPIPVPDRTFVPKLMNPDAFKGYRIIGVCAGRYHSVVYCSDAVFTFGLNAGQLGHARGDKYQIQPRMISGLNDPEIRISLVECSDSATVCLTTLGNVYVCNRYICRKIGSRWLDITKMSVSGGSVDHLVITDQDLLKQKGGAELMVVLLSKQGRVLLWREKSHRFKRCNWAIRREVNIKDVAINRNNIALVTDKGEGFIGNWLPSKETSKKKSQSALPKSREVTGSHEFPQIRLLDLLLKDEVEDVQLERIPNIHRATNIFSDPKGRNFAALQVLPNGCLTEIPYVREASIREDMNRLLQEVDDTDVIHDIIIQSGNRKWAAHKFILASRSTKLHKMIMNDLSSTNKDKPVINLNDINPLLIDEILKYIYTDMCTALTIDAKFQLQENCDNKDEDIDPKIEYMTKTQRKKYYKRLDKENSKKQEEDEPKTALCLLREVAEDLGIETLSDRLDCVKCVNGIICSNGRQLVKPNLKFNRTDIPELYDVCIRADDNTSIKCHKCILVARLEYFHSMLATGWIETSDASGLSLPIPGKVLQVLIDYIYTDDAAFMADCLNVELLCNILVLADKLLIERLKELSEVAIVNSLNFWNVADLLKFSLIYNAHQLYLSCQQFICLNLPVFLESKLLNSLDDDIIDKLTTYYRQLIPSMSKRIITPYSEGPTREYLSYLANNYNEDQQAVLCDVVPRKSKERSRSKSESDPPVKKAVNKKRKERQLSVCSDMSNKSEDGDNIMPDIVEDTNNSATASESLPICIPTTIDVDVYTSPSDTETTSPRDLFSPQTPPTSGMSLRDIMKAEEKTNKPNKKNVSATPGKSKISWKEAKKLQNQKEAEEKKQKAAEKKAKEKPKEIICPWANSSTKVVKSFRDLMVADESEKPVVKRLPRTSISEMDVSNEEYTDTLSLSKSPQDLSLSSWMSFPVKPKPKIESPPEEKPSVNPWQTIPKIQSPPLTDHSFTDILKDERHKKVVFEKIKKKPFKLVQIEDSAIQELLQHYKAYDNYDEFITVERVQRETASPMWIKEKKKSGASIW